ncbi:MAG: vitamin K epoxide reductase [Parcubacteria group bacterium Gr01-1014_56]|nr:MAG: vitamin K epoxide reductase [Parcubacteria group bacterium Gr01-1014_56]
MKLTPYILIALSFVGLADTLYLSYFAYLNLVPGCAIGGCEAVLTSAYSKFLGVPLAYIGVVFYVYMLALSVLLAIDEHSRTLAWAALAYTAVGVLFSVYFEFYIQGVLIGAYCMYCAISALVTLGLTLTAGWHLRTSTHS